MQIWATQDAPQTGGNGDNTPQVAIEPGHYAKTDLDWVGDGSTW